MKTLCWLILLTAMFFCGCGDDSKLPPIKPDDSPPKKVSPASPGGEPVDEVSIPDELKLLPGETAKPPNELADRGELKYLGDDENPYSGVAEEWHENGKRKMWQRYVDGQPHGKYFYWEANGQKRQEAEWKAGVLDGTQTTWWPNGEKKVELIWVKGVRREMREWDKTGKATGFKKLGAED